MDDVSSIGQYIGILQNLTDNTRSGLVSWTASAGKLSAILPSVILSLSRDQDGNYALGLHTPQGVEMTTISIMSSDFFVRVVQDLFAAGNEAAISSVLYQLNRDLESLRKAEATSRTTTTTTPPPPERPSRDSIQGFFEHIAGKWHLEYPHGEEEIEIDNNGFLTVLANKRGPVAHDSPKFRLQVLEADTAFGRVEIAKNDYKLGNTSQVEVWTVSEKRIDGYAKRDNHKVVYTRKGA